MLFGKKKLALRSPAHGGTPRFGAFVNTELLMALEKVGLFEYINKYTVFSTTEAAKELGLKGGLLSAACEFLAAENVLSKVGPDGFRLASDYRGELEARNNYYLAYKAVYGSIAELLNGSKIYGRDVVRDATRLGFGTRKCRPFLTKRFKELGIGKAVDIGCGRGNFLFALAEAVPGFHGIGIEVDKATVALSQKRFAESPYKDSVKILHGDAAYPESFPEETKSADAFYGVAIFHELKKGGSLRGVFSRYKLCFPGAKFFLIEYDTPQWDELLAEPDGITRTVAAEYLFTHYLTEQGLPQSKKDWIEDLEKSGWCVQRVYDLPSRLTAFECE